MDQSLKFLNMIVKKIGPMTDEEYERLYEKFNSMDNRVIKEPRLLVQPSNQKVTITIHATLLDNDMDKEGRFRFPFPNIPIFRKEVDLPEDAEIISVSVS